MFQCCVKAAAALMSVVIFTLLVRWLEDPGTSGLMSLLAFVAFITIANVILVVLEGVFSVEVSLLLFLGLILCHYLCAFLLGSPADGIMLWLTKATLVLISSGVAASFNDTLLRDSWLCSTVRSAIGR